MYLIVSRFFVKEQGWKNETVKHEGTMESAWQHASRIATAIDDVYGTDHFWNVRLQNEQGEDIVELFHGRLI